MMADASGESSNTAAAAAAAAAITAGGTDSGDTSILNATRSTIEGSEIFASPYVFEDVLLLIASLALLWVPILSLSISPVHDIFCCTVSGNSAKTTLRAKLHLEL
jgi:hypothetical protein